MAPPGSTLLLSRRRSRRFRPVAGRPLRAPAPPPPSAARGSAPAHLAPRGRGRSGRLAQKGRGLRVPSRPQDHDGTKSVYRYTGTRARRARSQRVHPAARTLPTSGRNPVKSGRGAPAVTPGLGPPTWGTGPRVPSRTKKRLGGSARSLSERGGTAGEASDPRPASPSLRGLS